MSNLPHSSTLATDLLQDGPKASEANNSSANSSRGGSRPGSSNGERVRGNHRVRFGSGEVLDVQNNRHTFNLRSLEDYQSSDNPVSATPATKTPPITLTSPNPSSSGRIYTRTDYFDSPIDITDTPTKLPTLPLKTPPRAFSFNSNDDDLELNEKYDKFIENDQLSSQERAARLGRIGSHSAPSSVHNSPTLAVYSVGAGQAQGGVPVDDIPLLDLVNTPPQDSGHPTQTERPQISATREAHHLVRQHTTRGIAALNGRSKASGVETPDYGLRSGTATPLAHQHEGYVQPPSQYRGGVLGSLLKLYNPPGHQGNHYGHERHGSMGSTGSPTSSGRTTPKWYNKSANTSTTSLGGLLAASGTALVAPVGLGIRKERPRMKHRPHSGSSGVVGALKNFSRHNLEEEIKITVHIAETLARQKYILKLCRALMLYGAPTHRLEEYMKMTSRVLGIDGQFLYIPGCMIISFGDSSTHTSEMHLVRTNQGVDLGKLHDTHEVYKEVVHDLIGVEEATKRLDEIMKRKPKHSPWVLIPVFGIASASVGPFGFKARPIDMPILFLLGCILGFLQLIVAPNSELYSNVFEISAAIITSFLARAFGSIRGGNVFCFSALAQASIALILPGYIILCGSLELQSRNLVAGSVRMFYAIVYSLFLGFGITIGSALYGLFDSNATSATTCQDPLDWKWNFLFVPPFAWCLLTINQARWRQAPVMIAISMAGYAVNFFSGQRFTNQPQVANSLGAFAVGVLGNLYSRVGHGLAFAAMLPAIFVQVPSGLAAQGSLISGIQNADAMVDKSTTTPAPASGQFNSIVLDVGFSMIQVAIGITVGLFAAALVVYPFGKKRSGLFSF
ncbi:DUF1212-domain-containing protein [Choiromyces venosus 120613-1]|uniref:DUF1212-domain-containing protein n=1 Tax=Choiromyces venosus 120613-1 TaxID=1336337 RepID=A0A3N4IUG6_9PEZI|nr:DUF1212-domain-containing protein [Choiromyces venosus 120613-1]